MTGKPRWILSLRMLHSNRWSNKLHSQQFIVHQGKYKGYWHAMSRQKFTWTATHMLVLAGNLVCFTEANRLKFFFLILN